MPPPREASEHSNEQRQGLYFKLGGAGRALGQGPGSRAGRACSGASAAWARKGQKLKRARTSSFTYEYEFE